LDFTTVNFTDVTRTFGRRRALNRVSLRLNAGEIIALLGPNGAGKSTLLGLAATLLEPTSGTIHYDTHTARACGLPLRRSIGLLGHDLFVYPELSAAENLEFFAGLYAVDGIGARVEAALEQGGIAARRDDPVSSLSRGMRQRLALERALLHDPRLVLLDEPFTGLDDASVGALQARLVTLRTAGRIVVVATHDLETIEPVVDRALVLVNGRLESIGRSGGSLRERYRTVSAAR
jgi:heme exporter protein A